MRTRSQNLFSRDATSLGAITNEWLDRNPQRTSHSREDVTAVVRQIENTITAACFDETSILQSVTEDDRRQVYSYVAQAACGMHGLNVQRSFNAYLGVPSSNLPDRPVVTEQVRRLRILRDRLADASTKNSSRI